MGDLGRSSPRRTGSSAAVRSASGELLDRRRPKGGQPPHAGKLAQRSMRAVVIIPRSPTMTTRRARSAPGPPGRSRRRRWGRRCCRRRPDRDRAALGVAASPYSIWACRACRRGSTRGLSGQLLPSIQDEDRSKSATTGRVGPRERWRLASNASMASWRRPTSPSPRRPRRSRRRRGRGRRPGWCRPPRVVASLEAGRTTRAKINA